MIRKTVYALFTLALLLSACAPEFDGGELTWEQVNQDGFGDPTKFGAFAIEVFNDQLFASSGNWFENGAQVWRLEGDGSWTAVSELRFGIEPLSDNNFVYDMIVFNGQLYAGTVGDSGQVWRTSDGSNWESVVTDGFGGLYSDGVGPFIIFNDMLYAGVYNTPNGAQIWRSVTGNQDEWECVIDGGNGDARNSGIASLIEFDGYLYTSVDHWPSGPADVWGVQIWRSSDGVDWEAVVTGGFGEIGNNRIGALAIFNDALYVSARNGTTGAKIYRSTDGVVWEAVVEDGFGDPWNWWIEMLYAVDNILIAGVDNRQTGVEIWQSTDGVAWTQANVDGFGDAKNISIFLGTSTRVFDGQLYIGVQNNETGAEVWRGTP